MTLNTQQTIIMNPSKLYHNVLSLLINDPSLPLGDHNNNDNNHNKNKSSSSSSARTCDSTDNESSSVSAAELCDNSKGNGKLADEQEEDGDIDALAVQQEQLEDTHIDTDTAAQEAQELSRPSDNDNEQDIDDKQTLGGLSSLVSNTNTNSRNSNSAPQLVSLSGCNSYCYNSSTSDISDNSNAEYAKWLQKELSRESGMDNEHDNGVGGTGEGMGSHQNAEWGVEDGINSNSSRKGNAAWGDFESELKQYSYKSSNARDFSSSSQMKMKMSSSSSPAGMSHSKLGHDDHGSHGRSTMGGASRGNSSAESHSSSSLKMAAKGGCGGCGLGKLSNTAHHHASMSTTSLDSATSRRKNRNRNLYGLTASIRE